MPVHIIKVIFFLMHMMNAVEAIHHLFEINRRLSTYRQSRFIMIKQMTMCSVMAAQFSSHSTERSCWMKSRTQSFWENDCQKNSEAFFKSNFRMKRSSFEKLCKLLKSLERNDTKFRKAISLEKRIATALYALGSSADYRTIANLFGVGKTTVGAILLEFCREAWKCLRPLYLQNFPLTENKIKECTNGFEVLGLPQVLGAIDGCHIEIRPGAADTTDYFNYKGWYSNVLLALVDARNRFIYISIGSPGKCNDSAIYEKSLLKQEVLRNPLMTQMVKEIAGCNVPIMLLGDSAFQLGPHLMKPHPFRVDQSIPKKQFNYNLSKCRIVNNTFGHLKARFRRVGKGVDNNIKNANLIIKTCCVLHNFLIKEKDEVTERWMLAQTEIDADREYPEFTESFDNNNIRVVLLRVKLQK